MLNFKQICLIHKKIKFYKMTKSENAKRLLGVRPNVTNGILLSQSKPQLFVLEISVIDLGEPGKSFGKSIIVQEANLLEILEHLLANIFGGNFKYKLRKTFGPAN
ncbi:hypothetical protein BpHYR1_004959 [Brachionus plicatilis]|uniref:Uncharacterized protein n=1 Tax=Brachionus plicatilis TaxID=10195 RepID=A0A3M7RJU6_BRAPC|nr:hypothetical protein BpHYR1_004959 [Brachionus plicatilis]